MVARTVKSRAILPQANSLCYKDVHLFMGLTISVSERRVREVASTMILKIIFYSSALEDCQFIVVAAFL